MPPPCDRRDAHLRLLSLFLCFQIGLLVGASLVVLVLSFQGALFWVRTRSSITSTSSMVASA